jgi:hypothetical protein
MYHHGYHWTVLCGIWYWGLLWKPVEITEILLISGKNIGHFI